jgi:hypothetical protein
MNARISHRLVGYDKGTGWVVVEYEIPPEKLDFAKHVAKVGDNDPDAVFCYRLGQFQAHALAHEIGVQIDPEALNFYMEGFAIRGKSTPDAAPPYLSQMR